MLFYVKSMYVCMLEAGRLKFVAILLNLKNIDLLSNTFPKSARF